MDVVPVHRDHPAYGLPPRPRSSSSIRRRVAAARSTSSVQLKVVEDPRDD